MQTKCNQSIPPDIAKAIRANAKALAGFERMPPSHQWEYLEYILEAKKPETRLRRITQAVAMMEKWEQEHEKGRR